MATTSNKPSVMVDANVLFAGIGWARFPYEVLRHAAAGDFQLVLSSYIIAEARTHLMRKFPQAGKRFDATLEAIEYEEVSSPSEEDIQAHLHLVRDPKDVTIALAAINARVHYLVTSDTDFTDPTEPIHQHLKVLLPAAFLRQHMGWSSEALEAIRKRMWSEVETASKPDDEGDGT